MSAKRRSTDLQQKADQVAKQAKVGEDEVVNLKETLTKETVTIPDYLLDNDVAYVSPKEKAKTLADEPIRTITKHTKQTDAFATFLIDYGRVYTRVAKAIRVMLAELPNASPIERGYAILKEITSVKRSKTQP